MPDLQYPSSAFLRPINFKAIHRSHTFVSDLCRVHPGKQSWQPSTILNGKHLWANTYYTSLLHFVCLNYVHCMNEIRKAHLSQGCHTLIKIKFPVFSLLFPCVLNFFPVFFSIKRTFILLLSKREYTTSNPLQTTIIISTLHFPVYQLKIYNKVKTSQKDSTTTLVHFYYFPNFKLFPVLEVNSLCKNKFLIFLGKFPVFSLSGKMNIQIPGFPCLPCAVAILLVELVDREITYQGLSL